MTSTAETSAAAASGLTFLALTEVCAAHQKSTIATNVTFTAAPEVDAKADEQDFRLYPHIRSSIPTQTATIRT
ncbi:hypothetical protein DOTSEDRAFT_73333 [Dothistroma septosporum NZE10]|uniref:Uncharacterized protein n=1 Tax=Dothistroma septosporum (strain NZE10 / CBS 128990) TaxID=675120 RepID=N1PM92_DOTSN|nr:hypothetical protein DOTSEDRAFT_73333 [Dothistroma septosporum NZE10]